MTRPKCYFSTLELSPCDNYKPVTTFWPCPEVFAISDKHFMYTARVSYPGGPEVPRWDMKRWRGRVYCLSQQCPSYRKINKRIISHPVTFFLANQISTIDGMNAPITPCLRQRSQNHTAPQSALYFGMRIS